MSAIDIKELLEQTDNDWELLREAFAILRQESPIELAKLEACFRAADASGVAKSAHTIKGMLANFCAIDAWNAASDIERAALANDLSNGSQLFSQLKNAADAVQSELQQLLEKPGHEYN